MASFLSNNKSILTVMLQCEEPDLAVKRIRNALCTGGEAFGLQVESLKPEYHSEAVYKRIVDEAKGCPTYFTNYRFEHNTGKTDYELADELLTMASSGATLCDIMGDMFDIQPDQVAVDPSAIKMQEDLIEKIHARGSEVLMSSHVMKFTSAERVLEIAREHIRRGADISKIVVSANSIEEEIENLRINNLLKEQLGAPFLFLSQGENSIHRRLCAKLGCCMTLCVYEHDALSTIAQPLLSVAKEIRDNLGF